MKANELMIGDWVRITDDDTDMSFVSQISGISSVGNIYARMPEGETAYPFAEDCAEPIPITPEILEKNFGVVERSSDGYNLVINRELILLAFHLKATLDFWIAQPRDCPHLTYSLPLPRYVHELQHALRLCGIKKEIEL